MSDPNDSTKQMLDRIESKLDNYLQKERRVIRFVKLIGEVIVAITWMLTGWFLHDIFTS